MIDSNLIMQLSKSLIAKIVPKELIYFDDLFEFIKDDIGLDVLLSLDKEHYQLNSQSDLGFLNNDAFLTSIDLIKIGTYISKKSYQIDSIRTKNNLREIIDSSIKELSYPQWLHSKIFQCLEEIYLTISDKEPQSKNASRNKITIILNGYKETISEIELSSLKTDKSFTIIVEERSGNAWIFGKLYENYKSKKKPFGILHMIVNNPPGTMISYEDMYDIVWDSDLESSTEENMREQINTRVRVDIKTLGDKTRSLDNYIDTIRGVGIKTSSKIKTLLIPHTFSSVE